MASTIVIGSGLAGYTVAREIHKNNKTNDVIVVTQDEGCFYSKPILSEAFRLNTPISALAVRTAEQMAQQFRGVVHTHTDVLAIDAANQTVRLEGRNLSYDNLILATGAVPAALPLDAASLSCVVSVNSLTDYRYFRQRLEAKKTVAIIGAGLVGCEFANDLAQAGYRVLLIDTAILPLSRLLPDANGKFTYDALTNLGIEWYLGMGVSRIQKVGDSYTLSLSDSTVLSVDVVVAATGLRPRIELAQQAGLDVEHGIVVDKQLRTSAPNIYALGDCAQIDGLWLPYIAPIAPAARVLAKALKGSTDELSYPSMPITIKTPACPTVVCPPMLHSLGKWESTESSTGVQSLFFDVQGQLTGFALSGSFVTEALALIEHLPALMAPSAAVHS